MSTFNFISAPKNTTKLDLHPNTIRVKITNFRKDIENLNVKLKFLKASEIFYHPTI